MKKMGRQINSSDKEILQELLKYYSSDEVKLDYDIVMEPCVFAKRYGDWTLVYKLTSDGNYLQPRAHYIYQASAAISQHFKTQWLAFHKNKLNDTEEKEYQENFAKTRQDFANNGFQDNTPND